MCSGCNYKNFEEVRPFVRERSLGFGSLVLRYYTETKEYKLAVKGEQKSESHVYHCPTCGQKLYGSYLTEAMRKYV